MPRCARDVLAGRRDLSGGSHAEENFRLREQRRRPASGRPARKPPQAVRPLRQLHEAACSAPSAPSPLPKMSTTTQVMSSMGRASASRLERALQKRVRSATSSQQQLAHVAHARRTQESKDRGAGAHAFTRRIDAAAGVFVLSMNEGPDIFMMASGFVIVSHLFVQQQSQYSSSADSWRRAERGGRGRSAPRERRSWRAPDHSHSVGGDDDARSLPWRHLERPDIRPRDARAGAVPVACPGEAAGKAQRMVRQRHRGTALVDPAQAWRLARAVLHAPIERVMPIDAAPSPPKRRSLLTCPCGSHTRAHTAARKRLLTAPQFNHNRRCLLQSRRLNLAPAPFAGLSGARRTTRGPWEGVVCEDLRRCLPSLRPWPLGRQSPPARTRGATISHESTQCRQR